MADIATLGVRVTTSGVKEAERDLKGLSKEGARAEAQADKIGAAWGKRLGVAVLAGTAVLAAGVAKVVRNTIEAEKVQAQLAARIKSTGGAAGLAVADLNKMADALQAATTFDDEAIGGAQSVLLTFTKIGKDVFPTATEAVLNLSTAFGTDLQSAALQVGKALNDPVKGINALARAGVQFTEQQKDLIKSLVETGQQAEAQRIILGELETQIGGAARAARDTLGGALQALSNAFDNALEGDTGGDGARGLTQAVNDLTDTLNSSETKQGIATLVEGLVQIASAAAQTAALIGTLSKLIPDAFKGANELDRQGLLDRETNLRDRIAAAQRPKPKFTGFLPAARENVAELQTQLDEVLKLEAAITRAANGRAAVENGKGSAGGSPNGRGRGVRGSPGMAKPDGVEVAKAATANTALAAATRDAANAERERQEIIATGQDALLSLTELVRTNAADLSGPAAQAAKAYADELLNLVGVEQQLQAAAQASGQSMADGERELALAREQAAQSYQLNLEAINAQKTAAEQLIEDLEFENKLMGLGNVARQQEIALRYAGADATEAQKNSIRELIAEQEKARDVAEAMDVVRDSTRGLFSDLIDGSKSAKDAFKDFVDNILDGIAQIVARNLTESLFGAFGSTGGGTGGDALASLFGSFFGGGRAIGGPVSGNRLYQVAEKGQPELLQVHGKQFLIPGGTGTVTPASAGGTDRGGDIYQTIQVTGTVDSRSAYQLQREASMRLQKAGAR